MADRQRDQGTDQSRRPAFASRGAGSLPGRARAQGRDVAYHRLLEALQKPGCPVCALRHEAVHRYLESVLYESVNDVGLRESLIRSRGFCRDHAWELVGFGDSLGIAIIYQDQIARALEDVQDARRRTGGLRRARGSGGAASNGIAAHVRRRRAPEAPCPACRIADEATVRYLATLVEHTGTPEVRQAVERSPFLCLPDLMRALEIAGNPDQTRAILEVAETKLVHLHGELAELIRKRDYRFAREPKGDEQTSWFRAIWQLVGWRPGRTRL